MASTPDNKRGASARKAAPAGKKSAKQPAAKKAPAAPAPEPVAAANGSDRRAAILSVAADLFAHKGVANTTVREIGDAAGILSGSLYHHFDSKESMVKEILERYFDEMLADYAEAGKASDPVERFSGLVRASLLSIERNPSACEIFQNDFKYLLSLPPLANISKQAEKVQRYWLDAIEEGAATGRFRGDVPPKVFYAFARDAVWFTVRWYRSGGPEDIDTVADQCLATLLNGYAAPA